jgi:hypothetical protein
VVAGPFHTVLSQPGEGRTGARAVTKLNRTFLAIKIMLALNIALELATLVVMSR